MKLLSTGGADHTVIQRGVVGGLEDYETHGLLLWAAWTFGALIELATNRYLKHYAPYHQYIHSLVGIFITVVTLLSSFEMIEETKYGERHLHNWLGIIMIALAILLAIPGIVLSITAICCELRWKKDFTQCVRKFHRIMGFFATIFALLTIGSGIYSYIEKSKWKELSPAGPINLGAAILTIVIWEILFRRWRKQETPWKIPAKTMTSKEFSEQVAQGKPLVILDNLVVDMHDYCKFHPGGKFTIKGNYGRDISKFFYGGYAMENVLDKPPNTHAHSNQARAIVNRYAIAVLDDQTSVAQPECKINRVTKVNEQTATYQFKSISGNPVKNWRNYYSNMDFLAKHFMVSNVSNNRKVSRHYTICHSMLPEFKADLIKLVDEYIAGDSSGLEKFKNTHLVSSDTNCINLTIKNYQKPAGLSTKVASVAENVDLNKSSEEL